MLHHNGEAAVVEMPPFNTSEKPPYEKAAVFLKKNRLYLKYGFLTHPHWDHCYTLPHFREKFPGTRFVAHRSFLEDPYFRFVLRNSRTIRGRGWIISPNHYFDEVFHEEIWEGDIGGEPIIVIHAPKHSYGDQIILFRGAAITGDWYLGDLKDCNDLVKTSDKLRAINFVQAVIKHYNYNAHMIFSGHGNHLFYNADFMSVLEQCKTDHGKHHPNISAHMVPLSNFRA